MICKIPMFYLSLANRELERPGTPRKCLQKDVIQSRYMQQGQKCVRVTLTILMHTHSKVPGTPGGSPGAKWFNMRTSIWPQGSGHQEVV